jgi:hypothetical protein
MTSEERLRGKWEEAVEEIERQREKSVEDELEGDAQMTPGRWVE